MVETKSRVCFGLGKEGLYNLYSGLFNWEDLEGDPAKHFHGGEVFLPIHEHLQDGNIIHLYLREIGVNFRNLLLQQLVDQQFLLVIPLGYCV